MSANDILIGDQQHQEFDNDDIDFEDFQDGMYSMLNSTEDDVDEENAGAGGDEERVGNWEIITEYNTTIEIDSIDQHLLDVARTEIPIVLGRLKAKMFGGRSRNLNTIPASKFMQAWMDATFLGYVKQFVNKNLTGDPVSNSEILAFI